MGNISSGSFLLLVCWLCVPDAIRAQVDSSFIDDTLVIQHNYEDFLEQSTGEDVPSLDDTSGQRVGLSLPRLVVRSRFVQDLQRSVGYEQGKYSDSRLKSYQRLLFEGDAHMSAGLLLTKDAGEPRMADFVSGNVLLTNLGPLTSIVIGDYRVEAGQGIALWRGYDFSKGGNVLIPAQRRPRGVASSLSSDETGFFRGMAADFSVSDFRVDLFYSNRSLAASVDSIGNVTSIYGSGFFRTIAEQAKRSAYNERLTGGTIEYCPRPDFDVGLTTQRSVYSKPLFLEYGRYFYGDHHTLSSLFYHVTFLSATMSGEWAYAHGTLAGISDLLLIPTKEIALLLSVRAYPYAFVSLHGFGFGERQGTANENGTYVGIKVPVASWCKISAYYDVYTFPVSTSRLSTSGKDILMEIEAHPMRRLHMTIRYQRKVTEDKAQVSMEKLGDRRTMQRARVQLDYRFSSEVTLRARAERVYLQRELFNENENGFLVYHEIDDRLNDRLHLNLRLVLFRTDSFDSRITTLERDLDGALSIPIFYGAGVRWYALVRYTVATNIDCSLKYSDVLRDDIKYYGSGLDQLPTNHDNRIGFQIDAAF